MPNKIIVEEFGGPEQLKLREVPSEPRAPGQLRVRIASIGVNRADVMMRSGSYHVKTLPLTPGLEASGVVVEGTPAIPNGKRVLIYRKPGGLYAEEAVVAESDVFVMPDGFDFDAAAAIPINWLTAYHCLFHICRLAAGETVLITAAASGVGQSAIQLAQAAGARVLAGVGSPEKADMLRERYKPAHAFVYTAESMTKQAHDLTGGAGADAALEIVGGKYFRPALLSLKAGGRLAQAANVTLEDSLINVRDFYAKNILIGGFQYGGLAASKKDRFAEDLPKIFAGFTSGAYRPMITRAFPLREAAEAHKVLVERKHEGKIVLTTGA